LDSPKNRALEHAMYDVAKNDNAQTREAVYRALLASTLLFEGEMAGEDNTRFAFKTVEHPPGNIILPVFTDVEALDAWSGPEAEWIALRTPDLFQSVAPTNIAEVRVNPFRSGQAVRKPGGVVKRHEFMALAQGLLPGPAVADNVVELKVAAAQQMFVEKPADALPGFLLALLTQFFGQTPGLQGVYLFQLANGAAKSQVIGLHFSADAPAQAAEALMRGVGELTRDRIPPGVTLDFMPLQPGPVLDAVRKRARVLLEKNPA